MRELGDGIDVRDNEIDLLTIEPTHEEAARPEALSASLTATEAVLRPGPPARRLHLWAGLTCILLGFGVIAVAFWLIRDASTDGVSEQIIVGTLGAVGGTLANFIAVIYLRMHSETVRSTTEFHNRLC
jgi:hypothetical protein